MSRESASGFAADALAQSEALHRRVRAFIDDSEGGCFDTLARDIARYQRQQVPAVARLAAAMGASVNAAAGLVACRAMRFALGGLPLTRHRVTSVGFVPAAPPMPIIV